MIDKNNDVRSPQEERGAEEPPAISKEDLSKILEAHRQWVESEGKEGVRADLASTNLEGADLINAKLHDANLQRADLTRANLEGADLGWAKLQRADLSDANLKGAFLSDANLKGARLINANLQGAILGDANLKRADLSDANLEGASFGGAKLEGAILSNAKLEWARLSAANLEGAFLADAQDDDHGWYENLMPMPSEQKPGRLYGWRVTRGVQQLSPNRFKMLIWDKVPFFPPLTGSSSGGWFSSQ